MKILIGVLAREQKQAQTISVSVDLYLDPSEIAAEDDIKRVYNYERIIQVIETVAKGPQMQLLETFAERLLEAYFEDIRVKKACIRIEKPDICPQASAIGLEIMRRGPV